MNRDDPSGDDLRAALRAAAAGHRPDRTAMLNRIAEQRSARPVPRWRPAGQAWRLAGSALAVAAVLGVGGVVRAAMNDGPAPTAEPAAPVLPSAGPVTTEPVTPAPVTTPPRTSKPAAPAATSRPPGVPVRPTSPGRSTGPAAVQAAGSVEDDDAAGRSVVTLKVREPVTALDLTVRVALTPDLYDQGAVTAAPGIGTTVLHEQDALVFRFLLAKGSRLAAGTYTFEARYVHKGGGRDAGDDSYRVTATSAAGRALTVRGDFS